MNANDKLVEILTSMQEATKEVVLFGKEQLPDVIEQVLMFKLMESICGIVTGVVLLIIAIKLTIFCYKKEEKHDNGGWGIMAWSSGFIGVMVFVLLLAELTTVLKIKYAPKVFLIEYAASLTKRKD